MLYAPPTSMPGFQLIPGWATRRIRANASPPCCPTTPNLVTPPPTARSGLVPPAQTAHASSSSSSLFQHLANHCCKLMPQTCPYGDEAVTADTQRCSGWHACQGVTVLMHIAGCRAARARTWMRRSSHTGRPSSSWTMLSARGGRPPPPPSRVSACCSLVLASQCAAANKNRR